VSTPSSILRQILPWAVTAAALGYVFGWAIDWRAIPEATRGAHFWLFVAITAADKLAFFLAWGLIQGAVVRRFVEPVPMRDVLAIKGGAELVRVANNSLADAAFLYGLSQLVRGRLATIVAVASIPFGAHFFVLLIQTTGAMFFLPGGVVQNTRMAITIALCWLAVGAATAAVHFGYLHRALARIGLGAWIDRVRARDLLPFLGWFALFALFDVVIQGLASRAFGVDIPWLALASRIPVLYLAISIPSLGNFGTREIAWANLFAEYGSEAQLYAFALWTNLIFLIMHALIGAFFVSRAFKLMQGLRRAKREGTEIPEPILRDAIDP